MESKELERTYIAPYSDAWWQARRGKITASSRLAVSTFGTNKQKNSLLDELKAELDPGFVRDPEMHNQYMDWGHEQEPHARRHIEFLYDIDTYEPGLLVHPQCDILAATPDWAAVLYNTGVNPTHSVTKITGEIKCPFFLKNHMKLIMGLHTNKQYEIQVQGQLLVTGAHACWFTTFHPEAPHQIQLHREIVEPDCSLHQRMLESCAQMSEMLKADKRFSAVVVKRDDTGIPQLF